MNWGIVLVVQNTLPERKETDLKTKVLIGFIVVLLVVGGLDLFLISKGLSSIGPDPKEDLVVANGVVFDYEITLEDNRRYFHLLASRPKFSIFLNVSKLDREAVRGLEGMVLKANGLPVNKTSLLQDCVELIAKPSLSKP